MTVNTMIGNITATKDTLNTLAVLIARRYKQ